MSNLSTLSTPNVSNQTIVENKELSLLQSVKEFFVNRDLKFYVALTGALAISGVGLYYYTASKSPRPKSSKKKKGKSQKGTTRTAASSAETSHTGTTSVLSTYQNLTVQSSYLAAKGIRGKAIEEEIQYEILSQAEIEEMPQEQRSKAGQVLKDRGNDAYRQRNYDRAAKLYTQAIAFHPNSVFYGNRAACYFNTEQYHKTIEDCSKALSLDPSYVKALNRRAAAYEQTDQFQEALYDYTASCILDNFSNETTVASMDRALKMIAEIKGRELMRDRKKRLPSPRFIKAYLDSYRNETLQALQEESSDRDDENTGINAENDSQNVLNSEENGDLYYRRACQKIQECDYPEALKALEKAVELKCTNLAQAIDMRGTFIYLEGDTERALNDFSKAIELKPDFIRPYIKRASIYMERGNISEAWREFDEAIKINPNDPDGTRQAIIFDRVILAMHRISLYFITGELQKASEDYRKSIELDGYFVFGYIQLAIAKYKLGPPEAGIDIFKESLQRFSKSADMHNYYGELLLDLQRFDEAMEQFDIAIELQKGNPLPYVNKALAAFQRQDPAQAEELCRKALEVDPDSDVANPAMSQILIQQGKTESALTYIEKCVEVSRTETEIVAHLQFAEAAKSHLHFARNYPQFADRLTSIRGDVQTIKKIIEQDENVFYSDENGISPLHVACSKGQSEIVSLLLEHGHPWNAIDVNGKTAAEYAKENGYNEIYQRLLEEGCRVELILGVLGGKNQEEEKNNDGKPSNEDFLTRPLKYSEDGTRLLDYENNGVMMGWEKPLMEKHAQIICPRENLGILNIGFGLGLIDTEIQKYKPHTHTIIEAHPDVYKHMMAEGWHLKPGVKIIFGRWQDVLDQLDTYDGIFFDTFGEFYQDLREFHEEVPNFLKSEGIYSFFNGLGATNPFFHDVYCQIVEMHLADVGLKTKFIEIKIDPSADEIWNGVKGRYWTLDTYRLPICEFMTF
ncbi:13164_t:CDS:10 [Ambispora gerdemannii]|uniref:13164_t:CDS:1 n=1 Tax=Ambispora gerdemannii TaxID=144530 RepID=A0A9N8ZTI2_9GLOM|nr:13164_t:CDS:10 [Ambispora gerdemannii]